jgi:hypothetical protein
MTNKFKTIAIAVLTILSVGISELKAQDKTTISVETDPLTYLFNGYSVHVRVKPKGTDRILVGAGMLMGPLFTTAKLPNFFVNLNSENKDKGWSVEATGGYSLFGEYFFQKVNSGWFVGEQIGIQKYRIKRTLFTDQHSDYDQLVLMTYGGYTFHLFNSSFYIKPWAGIGYTPKINGSNTLNGTEYNILSITPFVTFHIGYTF